MCSIAGCVVPGGGTYYQPSMTGGTVGNGPAIIAGHNNLASRNFNGLKIGTHAEEEGKFLHVKISLDVEKTHVLAGNLSLAKIETVRGNEKSVLTAAQPMIHMFSDGLDVERNSIMGGPYAHYTLYFHLPLPAPGKFVVVIPDLRLDGRQLGPLRIAYREKSGVWLYLISM